MKSTIFTFILLCLLSLSAFAQGETKKTEAYKIREIGLERISEDVKMAIWEIGEKFKENTNNSAVIINYGKDGEIYKRQAEVLRMIKFNWNLKVEKFQFLKGGNYPFPLTEFWVVPEGAEMPKPTNIAEKVDEIGKTPSGNFKNKYDSVRSNIADVKTLFILTSGNKLDKSKRLNEIKKRMAFLPFKNIEVILVDGGYSKELKTEFWILKK